MVGVTFRLLETTAYRAPLALQFVDAVGGAPVADGLVVTAWPAGDPLAARTATRSPISTILGFGLLPGLGAYEETVAPDSASIHWSTPLPGRTFEVRVVDPMDRYLPAIISVTVPRPVLAAPPLYSAPTRPTPSGFATVVGEVHSTTGPAAAGWALVQVVADGTTYTTLADAEGRFVVYLPYPEALPPLVGSPPSGGPLDSITWPLTIWVRYQPSAQARLADAGPADPPELASLLSQAPAAISTGGGSQPNQPGILTFGQPLRLVLDVVPA